VINLSTLRPWLDIENFIINWEFLQDETAAVYEEHGSRLCKIEINDSSDFKTINLQSLEFPASITIKRDSIWREQIFNCYRNNTQLFSRIKIDNHNNPKFWLYLNSSEDLIFKINYGVESITQKAIQDPKGANCVAIRNIKAKDNLKNWDENKTFMVLIRKPDVERLHILTFITFLLSILMEELNL
jgi:hypothetical protein